MRTLNLSGLRLFYFTLIVLGLSFQNIANALPDSDKKEELFHIKMISKNPRSEEYRYGYASYLYSHERFEDSKKQLDSLFQLNPTHAEGIKVNLPRRKRRGITGSRSTFRTPLAYKGKEAFQASLQPPGKGDLYPSSQATGPYVTLVKNNIKELEKIKEPNARKQKMVELTLSQMTAMITDITKSLNQVNSPKYQENMKEESKKRRVELDKKYRIIASLKTEAPISLEEVKVSMLISKYNINKEYADAEKAHLEQIKKYPKSQNAEADYIKFLIDRDRNKEAKNRLSLARKRFSQNSELAILEDAITEIETATSTEKRSTAKMNLGMTLLDYSTIRSDYRLGKMK